MSPTNIRKASSLLDRAGTSFDDQASIQPFGQPIYTVYVHDFPQETVDQYTKVFNYGIEGQWLSNANDPTEVFRVVDPSAPYNVPKVCISSVMKKPPPSFRNPTSDPSPQPKEPLDFLLVIQGKNANERSKIVVEHTLEDAATSMLHEAINGFSVVFTGALLRSDSTKLFLQSKQRNYSFKKVPDIAALNDFESHGFDQIGIIC
ncbi:MAG: hypothetical protein L6R38_004500 [Xanthoria sp. 2 TBL-2021]|nr:MAG: hypothetical protein L6R38_004500 [Xanthoria sp. 2 TBL-2021]